MHKIYLVGGAVRDKLLNLEVNDLDYIVETQKGFTVEETIKEFIKQGYTQVGKDFPVFLHPETKDEYALARTERKVGIGYSGFETIVENVSIEEDLLRRDLTINSIAYDSENDIYIEPKGVEALKDIEKQIIRPTSEAFVEDPLRILRLGRFSAKLPNFLVAYEDIEKILTKEIKKELLTISKERIFLELKKVLKENQPSRFFYVLKKLEVLEYVFPDIHKMIGKKQPLKHHSEGDVFEHTMMVLDEVSKLTEDPKIRFGALFHDIGKPYSYEKKKKELREKSLTLEEERKKLEKEKYHGHSNLNLVKEIMSDYVENGKYTKEYVNFALKSATIHHYLHDIEKLSPKKLTKMFLSNEFFSSREELEELIIVVKADSNGRIFTKSEPEQPLTKLEKKIIRKSEATTINGIEYKVGSKGEEIDYNLIIRLYDYIEKNKEKYQINKKLIETFKDENGKIDVEKKENYIYNELLKVIKTFNKEEQKIAISRKTNTR